MSTASRIGAAFGDGLLGLMLLSSPAMAGPDDKPKKQNSTESTDTDAAPGSADRDTEAGGSGTQGKSSSNPDGGGVDKPYEAAGQPAESQGEDDFDGNNGCGNDTDFADDNNGNCGGLGRDADRLGDHDRRDSGGVKDDDGRRDDTGSDDETRDSTTNHGGGAVLGTTETAPETLASTDHAATGAQVLGVSAERTPQAAPSGAQVLGVQMERGAPAVLAATGGPLGIAALAGFGLIGGGIAAVRAARK